MFSSVKTAWMWAKVISSIEGVIREAAKGNATAVQQWYYDYRKYLTTASNKERITTAEAEMVAFKKVGTEKAEAFSDIVSRLSRPGEILDEINRHIDLHGL